MADNAIKVTMGSVRLTGDQSRRLLEISEANGAVECYEYWDKRLEQLGLVGIGPIPDKIKAAEEKWIAASWSSAQQKMSGWIGLPSEAQIRTVEGIVHQVAYRTSLIKRPYTQLTAAGRELAKKGMTVALRKERQG